MKENLLRALAFVDEDEGPELNVGGSEPGGSSKHGVSMTVLREWHAAHGLAAPTLDDMKAVDAALAGKIYAANFADPIRFDDLPSGVDYRMLDVSVNLGVSGGATLLELVLGAWPLTGKMDDEIVSLAQGEDPRALILAIGAAWLSKKHESPNWNPSPITARGYGHGWTNRMVRANTRALSLIGAAR